MKISPLYDRVLLKRIEEQEVRKSGIIIPDTAKEKPQEAEVIAAGKGRVNDDGKVIPLEVKKGDKVLIGKVQRDGSDHRRRRAHHSSRRRDPGQGRLTRA